MIYLLDTVMVSILVHRRAGFERIAHRVDRFAPRQGVISSITLAELQTVTAKSANPAGKAETVWRVLMNFDIQDFSQLAAHHYGEIRAHLERRGERIGPMDLLIAAHARSLRVVLVTDNTQEFSRVPGLSLENWRR